MRYFSFCSVCTKGAQIVVTLSPLAIRSPVQIHVARHVAGYETRETRSRKVANAKKEIHNNDSLSVLYIIKLTFLEMQSLLNRWEWKLSSGHHGLS
jgi:hypothetical protein